MDRDPQELFREAWEFAAKRVNAGKHSKDRVRFFLTDGTTKTFDIPPMRDESMKDGFLELTLIALNNHSVEALVLTYEAWFVETDEEVADADLDEYLCSIPRPRNHPKRREGVNFYYEAADGVMFTALAEIVTVEKNKRKLARLPTLTSVEVQSRMSHFFQKAREYSKDFNFKNPFDNIFGEN